MRRLRAQFAGRQLARSGPIWAAAGLGSFASKLSEPDTVRGKAGKFYRPLFNCSQTPVEQAHIVSAFRFELSKVQTQVIRERVVSLLVNIAPALGGATRRATRSADA